ncbi:N-acetylmuramoyl-L-alanine amidase [Acidimangrovimonas sediminis]|uniref:N-acetylmuramoyl-L-alanine amidase n=1 Tax=Acidimangrovimonas sediminis TaxID=2056283 RepID=UPI001E3850E4|nr:N-acetylmuramoyl-L-alanine amidase [Acidimangrovimonas sediminis]
MSRYFLLSRSVLSRLALLAWLLTSFLMSFWAAPLAMAQTAPTQSPAPPPAPTQPVPTQPAAPATGAKGLTALARFEPRGSAIRDAGDGIALDLAISQPVPWRVRVLDDPARLVLDFREVDFGDIENAALSTSSHVRDLRAGPLRPGWSRLVLELDGPYGVKTAEMRTDPEGGRAEVRLVLRPESAAAFAGAAAVPDPPGWTLPRPADVGYAKRRQTGDRKVMVVIDPGHGGIDPGAVHGKLHEADIVLAVARKLREALLRAGGFDVVMTRDSDVFVPLETRVSVAREAGADLFLALHADSIAEGVASGATIYTLAKKATDEASAKLAARHDRDDLLSGVDLSGTDDIVAGVLMDLARDETMPRSEALAAALVTAIKGEDLRMHVRPHQEADFSVLKSPDIPSALLELGFLSSATDRKQLVDPAWQDRMVAAIVAGIRAWVKTDAAQAALLRQ